MAEGTVRGAFDLDVSDANRAVRSYRQEAARADVQTKRLGASIDEAFGPRTVASIQTAREEMRGLATTTGETRRTVRDEWKGMRREIQREAAAISSTIAVVRERMRALGRERATPQIDVSGIAVALTQVELLTARLEALGAMRPTPRVGVGGGFGGAAARAAGGGVGGAGRGGGAASLKLGNIGFAGVRGSSLLAAGALGLPAVQALGGAAVGIGSSAGAAALGAGAVGLGGLAPLVAGIAGVMSVAKPANAALKTVWKAQDTYTKAVRQHGKDSKQAAAAQRELTRVQRVAGPGSGYAAQQGRGFVADWRRMSAPARQQYFGLLGDVAQVGRRAAPGLARNALTATTAVRGAGVHQARFLAGNRMQDDLAFFTRTFARELPTAERTLENVERTLVNIARASVPFFHEANVWARQQTATWRAGTTDIETTRRKMVPLVDSAKQWAHLAGTTFRLVRDIGRLGRPSGDSLVGSLDRTFGTWDAWIQSHPQDTASFFRDTANSTREMASGLASAVGYLHQLATALRPLLDRFSQLVGLASSLGLIGAPGAIAAVVGGVRGARGRGGGGGGLAAGALGAGVLAGRGGAMGAAGGRATMMESRAGRLGSGAFLLGAATVGPAAVLARREAAAAARLAAQRGVAGRVGGRVGEVGRAVGATRGARRVGGAIGGAARGFAPIAGALGALDFATFDGTASARLQAALSSATLGLVHRPLERGAATGVGAERAQAFLGNISTDPTAAAGAIQRRITALRGRTFHQGGGALNPFGGMTFSGSGAERNVLGAGDTPEGRKVRGELTELGRAYREQLQTVRALNRAERDRLAQLSAQRGAAYGARLGSAFQVYRQAGATRQQAAGRVVTQVQHRLAGTQHPEGVEALGESSLQWARAMAKGHPEMRKSVDDLTKSIVARFKRMGRDVQIVNGDILRGTRSEWSGIAAAMSGATETARQKTSADFTAIQRQAIGSLIAMGMSRAQARSTVQGLEAGDAKSRETATAAAAGKAPAGGLKGSGRVGGGAANARGGMIGGSGLLDTVATPDGGSAAPGETWIANRHTMGKLSMATRAVFGLTAQQMIRGETRRHSAPAYARGGLAGGIRSLGNLVLGQFPGLSITSTTGGQHAPGSLHYRGLAEDISGPANVMNAAARWVGRNYGAALAEGIHNPGLSVKNGRAVPASFWGAGTWAGHADHIHLAVLGAALAGGGLAGGGLAAGGGIGNVRVRGLGRRQAGVPGVLRGRAGDIYAAGLQSRLNSVLGGGGGTAAAIGGGSLSQMIAAAGLPAIFNAIVRAESSGNARAMNASGATGLTQIMWPLHRGIVPGATSREALMNPRINLAAAKVLYDQSGLSPWAASRHAWGSGLGKTRGGRMKWAGAFDRGGQFVTDGPTAFVAGEGPRNRRERVTVSPAGSKAGGQMHVTFAPGSIVIHAGAGGGVDARAIGERVAAEILAALRKGSTAAVIG